MAAADYYEALGVSSDADPDAIKKAYRKLARQNHPDTNPDDPLAEERFKEISAAYQVLSDPDKRRQYDQMRAMGAGGGPGGFAGFGAGGPPGGWQSINVEDLQGFGGLGDLFSTIFGQGMGGRARAGPAPRRGADRIVTVQVSFKVAARGGKIAVSVPFEESCERCGGEGSEPGTSVETCPTCQGSGHVSISQGGFVVQRPCPHCFGRGRRIQHPCRRCGGDGRTTGRKKIEVRIPAGIEDGGRIRLRGRGAAGIAGGPPGDLMLRINIKPDRFFTRRGLDIQCEITISFAQAALGTKVRVKTVHGKRVELSIPPGTQAGTKLRVRGQGIHRGGERGDQYVEVNVAVPEELSEEERALVEQMASRQEPEEK